MRHETYTGWHSHLDEHDVQHARDWIAECGIGGGYGKDLWNSYQQWYADKGFHELLGQAPAFYKLLRRIPEVRHLQASDGTIAIVGWYRAEMESRYRGRVPGYIVKDFRVNYGKGRIAARSPGVI